MTNFGITICGVQLDYEVQPFKKAVSEKGLSAKKLYQNVKTQFRNEISVSYHCNMKISVFYGKANRF